MRIRLEMRAESHGEYVHFERSIDFDDGERSDVRRLVAALSIQLREGSDG